MDELVWLHLSDVHFRPSDEWHHSTARDALLDFLPKELERLGIQVDLIFCTGDIAFGELKTQTLVSQYKLASSFFDQVLKKCECDKTRLFMVPGNHDIDRNCITEAMKLSWTHWGADKQACQMEGDIQEWFAKLTPDAAQAMRKLDQWGSFVADYMPHKATVDGHHHYAQVVNIRGRKIGIAGFNSAWSCSGSEDDRHLWLAAGPQFDHMRKILKDADLKLGLIHHPWDYFNVAERETIKRRIGDEAHFWLHGHLHNIWMETLPTHVTVGAGAVTAPSEAEFGFNLMRLDFESGYGSMRPYGYQKNRARWIRANQATQDSSEIWRFDLPQALLLKQSERKDATPEVDPPRVTSIGKVKKSATTGENNAVHKLQHPKGAVATNAVDRYARTAAVLPLAPKPSPKRLKPREQLIFLSESAWSTWESGSLLRARELYLQLAKESEQHAELDATIREAIATDAYRRIIGIDLELMEPLAFLKSSISVLGRRQTHVTFNSILNRLVLFCAKFGFPSQGYAFAKLAFNYIGDGGRENEGTVLCSELGSLYAPSSPQTALSFFKSALPLANDKSERACTVLAIHINEWLHQGVALNLGSFDALWEICSFNRFSETLTRASLLRGSLLLRERDVENAGQWIKQTETWVQLHNMKQFQMAISNDQVLYSLLLKNDDEARSHFVELQGEFERIEAQLYDAVPLVDDAFAAATKAASTLQIEPSLIKCPNSPPKYCDPIGEMRWNIANLASMLGFDEIATRYASTLGSQILRKISDHRQTEINGTRLILGAY